jgi:hypothetical protein
LAGAPGAALLHDGFVYHRLRVRLLEDQLARLFRRLAEVGAEAIVGKGWAVARGYPMVGLRPYGDLDLLVGPEAEASIREVLAAWDGIPPAVELHGEFNELDGRSRDDLLGRSRTADLAGDPVRIFGPEDHLRLLALHALEHGLARPFWLCDLGLLLETLPPDFDWALCLRGRPWEAEGIRCALGLTSSLLGVDLAGPGVPAGVRGRPLPGWLIPAALEALGAHEHYLQAGDPDDQLLSLRPLLRSARLRWANPIEATFRRRAPWRGPRLPVQMLDYTLRSAGFALRAPSNLLRLISTTGC